MSDFRLERMAHDRDAFYSYMKSEPVREVLASHARQIADDAGRGYEPSVWIGDSRAVGNVRAESWRARRDNARNQTLLRALGRRSR